MYTAQKNQRKTLKTPQISMGKNIMQDIYTDMDWVICQERKDATLFNGNESYQPTDG